MGIGVGRSSSVVAVVDGEIDFAVGALVEVVSDPDAAEAEAEVAGTPQAPQSAFNYPTSTSTLPHPIPLHSSVKTTERTRRSQKVGRNTLECIAT